jgi:hypothetical protein
MLLVDPTHSEVLSAYRTARPLCSKCGTATNLTRLTFDSPGYERRTFECLKCNHSEVYVVKSFAAFAAINT